MNKVSAYGPDGGIMMTIEQAARECATDVFRQEHEKHPRTNRDLAIRDLNAIIIQRHMDKLVKVAEANKVVKKMSEHRMSREWQHSGLTCRVREIPEESRAVMEFRAQFNAVGAPSWIATADMNIVTFERLLALEASVYGKSKEPANEP